MYYFSNPDLEFMTAIKNGQTAKVVDFLRDRKYLKVKNQYGENGLIEAASLGNLRIVELLLDAKIDATVLDRQGWDALMHAVRNGHHIVLQILLDSLQESFDLQVNCALDNGDTYLIMAARWGHVMCVKVLVTNNFDVNVSNQNGDTALFEAVRNGFVQVAKILVDNGADTRKVNRYGKTAADIARSAGNIKLFEIVRPSGGHKRTQSVKESTKDKQDTEGNTYFMYFFA